MREVLNNSTRIAERDEGRGKNYSITDISEERLQIFFANVRRNDGKKLKWLSMDALKSHILMGIKEDSLNTIDISKLSTMKAFFHGIHKDLKENGLADAKHFPEIEPFALLKIYCVFCNTNKTWFGFFF